MQHREKHVQGNRNQADLVYTTAENVRQASLAFPTYTSEVEKPKAYKHLCCKHSLGWDHQLSITLASL